MKIEAQEGTFKPITITFETQEEYDSFIGTLKRATFHRAFPSESNIIKKILDYDKGECEHSWIHLPNTDSRLVLAICSKCSTRRV